MVLASSGEFLYFVKGTPTFPSNYIPHPLSYPEIWQPVPVEIRPITEQEEVTFKSTVFLHKNCLS